MVNINTEICRKSRENVEKMSRITLGNFPDLFSRWARWDSIMLFYKPIKLQHIIHVVKGMQKALLEDCITIQYTCTCTCLFPTDLIHQISKVSHLSLISYVCLMHISKKQIMFLCRAELINDQVSSCRTWDMTRLNHALYLQLAIRAMLSAIVIKATSLLCGKPDVKLIIQLGQNYGFCKEPICLYEYVFLETAQHLYHSS